MRVVAAILATVLLAGCGGGGDIPVLEDAAPGGREGAAQEASLGPIETFDGRVVAQDLEYGEPVPAAPGSERMLVPELVVLTVERLESQGAVEIEIVQRYVEESSATLEAVPTPLAQDTRLRFTVRSRGDGRYVCALVCLQEAP